MTAQVTHCFERRTAKKQYLALVHGHPPLKKLFTFKDPIAEDPTDPTGFRMCAGRLMPDINAELAKAKRRDWALPEEEQAVRRAEVAAELAAAPPGAPPAGRSACTNAVVLEHGTCATTKGNIPCSLVVLAPTTGRRHQLRVHCMGWGHPIVGDLCYCEADRERGLPRMMLHAWRLSLPCDTRDTDGRGGAETKAARKRMRKEKMERGPEGEVTAECLLEEVAELLKLPPEAAAREAGSGEGPSLTVRTGNRLAAFLRPVEAAEAAAAAVK
eukprot:Hpha_TRINITY_DN5422_c0_g1::TRINITY_DN5422_c0_g1_i1::g.192470::m.192470